MPNSKPKSSVRPGIVNAAVCCRTMGLSRIIGNMNPDKRKRRVPPDFSKETIEILAKRAAQRCSKPGCNQLTSGPHSVETKATNLGRAAHIRGARKAKNNRFDENITVAQRAHISNGIWLCTLHADEIDTDEQKFTVELLDGWRSSHEADVARGLYPLPASTREINVSGGGIGSIISNSGPGIGMDISHTGTGCAERIISTGGVGEIVVNSGPGIGKRIVKS